MNHSADAGKTNPIRSQTKPISNAENNPAAFQKQALFGVATLRYVCIEADLLRSLKLKAILIRCPAVSSPGRFLGQDVKRKCRLPIWDKQRKYLKKNQICSTLPDSSPIIRENKMLTESVFGEIIKFSLLLKVLRFLHVS